MHRLAVLALFAACDLTPAPNPDAGTNAAAGSSVGSVWLSPAADPWAHAGWIRPALAGARGSATAVAATAPARPAAIAPPPVTLYGPAPRPPGEHLVVAAPTQALRALAVTEDGTVAVSSDVAGSVRLWPALDGTREPVIIAMRRPVALAITRASQELVIAGVDGAGQLELVYMSALGESQSRSMIDLPRPVVAVHATPSGFLVECDDQRLVFVGSNGILEGEADAPPGMHIAALAVRGNAMLAVLDGGGAVFAQWLTIAAGKLVWGKETGALPIEPRAVALSPNLKTIAAVTQNATTTQLVLVDLAHGDRIAEGPNNNFIDPSLEPLGFLDSDTVLVRTSGFGELWHPNDGDNPLVGLNDERRPAAFAVGGQHAVFGNGSSLILADTSNNLHYLGFRLPELTMIAPAAHSLLASDGQHLVRIGTDLREHATYELPDGVETNAAVAAVLDGNHVLVQTYDKEIYLKVVALDTQDIEPVAEDRFLGYEPTSKIIALASGTAIHFRRFDSKTGRFGPAAELETGSASSNVAFTAVTTPAAITAMVTTWSESTYTQRTVSIRPESTKAPIRVTHTRSAKLDAEVEGFPAADVPAITLRHRSPDGALAITLEGGQMSLRDKDGRLRWTAPMRGASDVVWLTSGELLAYGSGLARVDLETGALLERRCGWQFGLWSEPVNSFSSALMCEME